MEGWYRGGGWYADGDGRAFDHYNGWALHLYPVLDAHLGGDTDALALYGERLRAHLDGFALMFGSDGAPLHFGRSLTYRFAASAAVGLGALTGHTPLTPGASRRLVSGSLRYFVDRGALTDEGVLSAGWYGPHEATLQSYSGPASPYWASKAFVSLLAPADHPLWTAPEEPAPVEEGDRVLALPAPGLIKFPDVVHAAKPHPDREIPQAQSAHDTFWDFVSLHTEATHHTIFFMGDRGIPRSYRMMEGFGVHTFRLVNAEGATTLVKFHWKPKLGVHSLVWDEAQIINGVDPDFHRRDLADAIEAGAYPQWELGIQTFPDNPEQTFEGIDLLDPTNLVPEELAPVQPVGLLTLNRNPSNFFAETEQIAFHVGHLVPGIDVTDDPLLAGRLFSYLDTQITRLGGPNFPQLPINRPQAPVNDMLRDGMHQSAVHRGVAPYRPNSLDGGCPFTAGADTNAF
ncbi:hypothetical protein SVIOM342S_09666 [Streptomyces violaceorubidus]